MNKLRDGLPALPQRMESLPIDARGYPVPWFVAWIDGHPDFRCVRRNGVALAHNRKTCWLCGQTLGTHLAFVIGPMCSINRVISEPPSHRECAEFAVKACPFLTTPMAKRVERDMPEGAKDAAGVMLKRNPGVACLWMTRSYAPFHAGNGVLFQIGDPDEVTWWAQGRPATRVEVDASIESGLPLLRKPAEAEGPKAIAALEQFIYRALPLRPAA